MTTRVLIIEDETKLASLLADYCRHAGFQVIAVDRGAQGLALIRNKQADVVLLDLMLPDGDGLDICKQIRQFSSVPILITSARVDELDRLLGLELGADDYICKPFSPREVIARIKAILRRLQQPPPQDSGLLLDDQRLVLHFEQKDVALTSVEFALMAALADHPGHIRSRQQLMDRIYTDHRVVSDRTIDSHVKKLRQKLAEAFPGIHFIDSVYGAGYRLGSLKADSPEDAPDGLP
ncbi:MAG: two-component system response regulator BaeR [Gammaproteobacteria bacterium HGW-Gammaproteobacteria-14]|nr:MAG: two-component system response regulator BaeR [Gammaproteobacteria bacterium HGW-Gammaproteobacteria-14]